MKLLKVDTIDEARGKLTDVLKEKGRKSAVKGILDAAGYVLAEDIRAEEPVPAFRRSTVDGYAVRALDTGGASENMPVFLKITGEVKMGQPAEMKVAAGECVYVPTGGMVPDGTDAVVMVEYCELFSSDETAIYKAAAPGTNVVQPGEDMKAGELILSRGRKIRHQETGALAALGITEVPVYEPFCISIISTGDELVSPSDEPYPGQVRDINTYGLHAQALKWNFRVRHETVLRDDRALLMHTVKAFMADSDIVVVSGGSSQGKKDVTASVIEELASEGVFTHGLALKPGKPTITGYDKPSETLLLGLPGHPAAAMIVFEILAGWLWRNLTGEKEAFGIPAVMSTNVPAAPGRQTCQLVKIERGKGAENLAVPVLGRSGLITTLTKADGYVLTGEHAEGLKRGEHVTVYQL
ncbi:molybdopterin molybdotransferase MoeA [Dorea sp. D27]|uniref:molybdopterin molybdotransferase MoeA n=1 Tax=Dorea sp. D27 TaxID=658665 RepID=UPI000673BA08|nr:gephyrin-like molybdotransferase Glp [Dorea sp. D27]KMZ55149.1 putative molybdopterin biosynthesis MoeA protein [Dorea sp. D27]